MEALVKPLLTKKQAAALLGKKESWVAYAAQCGLLGFVRVGQALRFQPEAIERWVREHSVPARRGRRPS